MGALPADEGRQLLNSPHTSLIFKVISTYYYPYYLLCIRALSKTLEKQDVTKQFPAAGSYNLVVKLVHMH